MHPVTRGEDYMANLQDGWLAFESGREKRRLAPYPADWLTYRIPQLEELCGRASLVIRSRAKTKSGERRAVSAVEIEHEAIKEEGSRRTFLSPSGREWTVRIHESLDAKGRQRTVLRLSGGDVVVELSDWPENWRTASIEEYALMLLDADPPRRLGKGEGPQRRREDRAD
jgi:hypothetical protein